MGNFLEAVMMMCFGLSWPMNVRKNWTARSAKGMSLPFFVMICLGYTCGICAKFITGNINYVLVVYIINIVMVGSNIPIYFRNLLLDKKREKQEAAAAKD